MPHGKPDKCRQRNYGNQCWPGGRKVNAEWAFLTYLRDLGRTAASDWLEENYDAVGKRPTLDLSGELDDGFKPVRGPAPGRRVKEFLAARMKPRAARRQA